LFFVTITRVTTAFPLNRFLLGNTTEHNANKTKKTARHAQKGQKTDKKKMPLVITNNGHGKCHSINIFFHNKNKGDGTAKTA